MAQRTQDITIQTGRDKGRTYRLTEKSPWDAEWWAMRALLACGAAGVELPDNFQEAPLAALAQAGLKSLMRADPAAIKPLWDEMLDGVQWVSPDKTVCRPLLPGDIEEVGTLLTLRKAVLDLHIGFFTDAEAPTSA